MVTSEKKGREGDERGALFSYRRRENGGNKLTGKPERMEGGYGTNDLFDARRKAADPPHFLGLHDECQTVTVNEGW
jgi:hypothetical protein